MVQHSKLLQARYDFALDALADLIFNTTIQPTFSARKHTDLIYGRSCYEWAMSSTTVQIYPL